MTDILDSSPGQDDGEAYNLAMGARTGGRSEFVEHAQTNGGSRDDDSDPRVENWFTGTGAGRSIPTGESEREDDAMKGCTC